MIWCVGAIVAFRIFMEAPHNHDARDYTFVIGFALLAVSIGLRDMRIRGPRSIPFAVLAGSLLLASLLYAVDRPSPGDPTSAFLVAPIVAFAIFPAVVIAGLKALGTLGAIRTVLDAAFLGSGMVALTWGSTFGPLAETSSNPLLVAVYGSFPVLAFSGALITVPLWSAMNRRRLPYLFAIAIGLMMCCIAYVGSLNFRVVFDHPPSANDPYELVWVIALTLCGIGTLDAQLTEPMISHRPAMVTHQLITTLPVAAAVVVYLPIWSSHPPTDVVLAMLVLFAGRVILLMYENDMLSSRLLAQANHDELTGLRNRRGLLGAVDALDRDAVVSVFYLDLDGFKQVNDRSGHFAGDMLLQSVGAALRRVARPTDLVGRMGGDEFVVVTSQEGDAAERLIVTVRETAEAEGAHWVTASVGVATGRAADVEDLLAEADRALYVAKSAGRNRVERRKPVTSAMDGTNAKSADYRSGSHS